MRPGEFGCSAGIRRTGIWMGISTGVACARGKEKEDDVLTLCFLEKRENNVGAGNRTGVTECLNRGCGART